MKIIRKKKLYCYPQEFRLKKDNKNSISGIYNHKIRYIISDHELKEEDWYEAVKNAKLTYDEWLERNWWPIYNGTDGCEIEELTECGGWNGIYQLLPIIINVRDHIEFIISVEFDSDDCYYDEEDNTEEIKDMDSPNFILSKDFYVLNRCNNVMLGWGNDKPYYEINKGSIKWDVLYRSKATLIFSETLISLFGRNMCDDHGIEEPYKAKITIKGKYCDSK